MPFVMRDSSGAVVALVRDGGTDAGEEMSLDHPDVLEFLDDDRLSAFARGNWLHNDASMARVVEDLIDVLLARRVLDFVDLPLEAQQKILMRRGRRNDLDYLARLNPPNQDDELGD